MTLLLTHAPHAGHLTRPANPLVEQMEHQLEKLRSTPDQPPVRFWSNAPSPATPPRTYLRLFEFVNKYASTGQTTSVGAMNAACGTGHPGAFKTDIPETMSFPAGVLINCVEPSTPAAASLDSRWWQLTPFALTSGREYDLNRLEVVNEWLWTQVVPRAAVLDIAGSAEFWAAAGTVRTRPALRQACRAIYGRGSCSTVMRRFDYGLELTRRARQAACPQQASYFAGYGTSALLGGVNELRLTALAHGLRLSWSDLNPSQLLAQVLEA